MPAFFVFRENLIMVTIAKPQPRTLIDRERNVEVVTPYTDDQAFRLLRKVAKGECPDASDRDIAFAASLVHSWDRRGLTARQIFYAHKLCVDLDRRGEAAERKAAEPRKAPIGDFTKLIAMFAQASSQLKHPKILFQLPNDETLRLSVAGPNARVPGSITVATGRYGDPDGKWYGRILHDGTFEASNHSTPEVEAALIAFAANPAEYAGSYGRKTGNCCFCSRDLTDERSTSVGYGPHCAARYGLPWGDQ